MVPVVSAAPMGWSVKCADEKQLQNAATELKSKGLDKLGYEYLLLDECWMSDSRGQGSHLQPD